MPDVTLTSAERAAAAQQFALMCATCHGEQGRGISGGSAPALTNPNGLAQIRNIIESGGVEMPAFGLQLDDTDVSLLARYVVMLSVPGQ